MSLLWLLVFIPISLISEFNQLNPILIFFTSSLAILPLAKLMGDATEMLAKQLNSNLSALLCASVGTIPDIIIGGFALSHGLVEVVKAAITGAIIGNLLFGLGMAITIGGVTRRQALSFDHKNVHLHGGLLLLASIGLIIPALFDFSTVSEEEISLEVSVVLLLTYLLSVIFTFTDPEPESGFSQQADQDHESGTAHFKTKQLALWVLLGSTAIIAVMSELLTDALEPAADIMGLTPIFTGIFLLAPVGSAVEFINASRFAKANQLDISLASTMGSSTQMALLAAPILVFIGYFLQQPMNLIFSKFQVVSIILAVVAVNNVMNFGQVRWISGAKLISTYLILAIGFYAAPY